MPSSSRDLIVRILADTSKLNDGVNETNSKLGGLGKAAKVAGTAFAAFAAADVATDFLMDATKAAEEDKKSQALLANQLKETNNATDDQIDTVEDNINALSRQTGVMDDDLRPAYAALARATGDTETANRELAIAMDIAAGRGVDLATVTAAMEKAHNGNIGALGRLGVATKDAEGNTLSLEEAMAKASETYKGAAEAAVTPGQRMSVAFNELKEQVGTALLPVMENLSTFMADTLLPAFQDAIVWIQENWPAIEKAIKSTFDKIKPWLDEFVHSIELAFDIISGVFKVVSDLLHGHWADAWRDFKDMIGNVFGDIVKLVQDNINKVKEYFGGLISFVADVPGKIATAASGMFQGIKDAASLAARWVGDRVDDLVEFFLDIPKRIAGLGGKILAEITGGAAGIVGKALNVIGLASGGIVTKPTLAIVGESGPEAVVPLGGGVSVDGSGISPLGSMSSSGGGGITIQTANFYGVQNVRQLVAELNDFWRINGGARIPGGVTAV